MLHEVYTYNRFPYPHYFYIILGSGVLYEQLLPYGFGFEYYDVLMLVQTHFGAMYFHVQKIYQRRTWNG